MKVKAILTIGLNQYENIKPEIEVSVPDGLTDEELIFNLWDRFHGLTQFRPNPKNAEPETFFRPDTMSAKPISPKQKDYIEKMAALRGLVIEGLDKFDSWQASKKIAELKGLPLEVSEAQQKAELDQTLDLQFEDDLKTNGNKTM